MVEPEVMQELESCAQRIANAKHEKINVAKYVNKPKHLSADERNQLCNLLSNYQETLFSECLGCMKRPPVSIKLEPGKEKEPVQSHPFSVPHIHLDTLKKEISRLVEIGVLEKCSGSSWLSPSFIILKKLLPGETIPRVHVVSDFWKLNKKVQCKPYPIPKIADTLHELGGFRYCTALNLSMGYWHICLDTKTQEMCTITFLFGTYKYKRLPMGIVSMPGIFQGKIHHLMSHLEWVHHYLDDIL